MMTLIALMMATFLVLAIIPVTVGQTLVRRKQAQMIVDAAAMAGAQQQAKALNSIARINEKAWLLLNAINTAQWGTIYVEKWSTTDSRGWTLGLCCPDWVKDMWKSYNNAFTYLNQSIDAVNIANGITIAPFFSARRVVDNNFGGDDTLFHGEQPIAHGWALAPQDLTAVNAGFRLVKLTQPSKYKVGGMRLYFPAPNHYGVSCGSCVPPIPDPYCCFEKGRITAAYAAWNIAVAIKSGGYQDGEKYSLGRFYDMPKGNDVRFTYWLVVEGTDPIVGSLIRDVPPILVVATAKPFGGHLGEKYKQGFNVANLYILPNPVESIKNMSEIDFSEGMNFFSMITLFQALSKLDQMVGAALSAYTQKDNKEISYTYKAKLVRTSPGDRAAAGAAAAVFSGVGGADLDTVERWSWVTH